jgi:hypothetical protein
MALKMSSGPAVFKYTTPVTQTDLDEVPPVHVEVQRPAGPIRRDLLIHDTGMGHSLLGSLGQQAP